MSVTVNINATNPQSHTGSSKYMCCIIIPIYKINISEYEIISLKQCCAILGKHPIIFVTHNKLDCTVYNTICDESNISYKYEYFSKKYFSNISCYNSLLLSKRFYSRFINYEYMLIYQLDAYVFKDELEYWCKKGYDYIGAPWLKLNKSKTMPEFDNIQAIGNGGFSLRNIKKIITIHSFNISIISFFHFLYYNEITFNSLEDILFFIPKILFRVVLKSLKFIFHRQHEFDNEDVKWSKLIKKKGKFPSITEAVKFSFENFPEYLYQLNNGELPFGCHDWYKYYNLLFYKSILHDKLLITSKN